MFPISSGGEYDYGVMQQLHLKFLPAFFILHRQNSGMRVRAMLVAPEQADIRVWIEVERLVGVELHGRVSRIVDLQHGIVEVEVFDARGPLDFIDDGLVDGREGLAGRLVDGGGADERDLVLFGAVENGNLAPFGEFLPLDGLVEEGEEVVGVVDDVSLE